MPNIAWNARRRNAHVLLGAVTMWGPPRFSNCLTYVSREILTRPKVVQGRGSLSKFVRVFSSDKLGVMWVPITRGLDNEGRWGSVQKLGAVDWTLHTATRTYQQRHQMKHGVILHVNIKFRFTENTTYKWREDPKHIRMVAGQGSGEKLKTQAINKENWHEQHLEEALNEELCTWATKWEEGKQNTKWREL